MNNKKINLLITAAIFLKSILFLYATINAPDLKVKIDTSQYLKPALALVTKGAFGKNLDDGSFAYEYYRTPGYPLFLGVTHGLLKFPLDGVIALQILLTIASAIFTYNTAHAIDPRLGIVSLIIILFDPAITVYSLMLLSESLYLCVMSAFMYVMVVYLSGRKFKHLFISALLLTAATYIRPISFYLGFFITFFILAINIPKGFKRSMAHALLFIITVYSLLFIWQWRNYQHFRKYWFSSNEHSAVTSIGMYKSYQRNKDPLSQGLPPAPYYLNVSSRCLLSLMTRPASFKYFESDLIKKAGKIFSYPWIAFWLTGFLWGLSKMGKNIHFYFLLIVTAYFICTTVGGIMWVADARFRVPMMPYIAILSAHGWDWLRRKYSLKTWFLGS